MIPVVFCPGTLTANRDPPPGFSFFPSLVVACELPTPATRDVLASCRGAGRVLPGKAPHAASLGSRPVFMYALSCQVVAKREPTARSRWEVSRSSVAGVMMA